MARFLVLKFNNSPNIAAVPLERKDSTAKVNETRPTFEENQHTQLQTKSKK